MNDRWWERSVVYQIYPRSFQDSNGDGIGDLQGIRRRLDYLEWLGVDALWLTPIMPSPDDDYGYDVSDYRDVHPQLGTLDDVKDLIEAARSKSIRIILDLVPNHVSNKHGWFTDGSHDNWFVWTDRPNNWLSVFGGSAWTWHEQRGRYYLHQFLESQPDLNWFSSDVRAEFESILRFWFDLGVSGFRIDCANRLVKDPGLRDNPPLAAGLRRFGMPLGQEPRFTTNLSEVHEIYRSWRRLCTDYDPERLLIGETVVFDPQTLASYYGADDELQLNFNFMLTHSQFSGFELRAVVEEAEHSLPPSAQPCWALGSHDISRFATRWCKGDQRKAQLAMTMLLTLRGTPVLYQGDELGLTDGLVAPDQVRDRLAHQFPGQLRGRDPFRTPIPWSTEAGGGFTAANVQPWLPLGSGGQSVDDQVKDRSSFLNFTRGLLMARRSNSDLNSGSYRDLGLQANTTWAYQRGHHTLVALNFGDAPATAYGLRLGPWEGRVKGM